ncbi:hypothetical protein GYMLUDRAFT_73408 [Collybiopsis luxurians FD-317 M1]|uniref:AB hydrolase-1 domain-containing protein n=1 Tax=Collybiopsis luxurians FD-317 M1 TaxID=944289 RepID=A0A0D0BZU3_9AGAR|nr:hypothetical protein GYMLUDRAFT_73408 [Collybiopsis luxurians FD-317 M1]
MIGKSLPEYIFIRISIYLLRSVAPASFLYLCFCFYSKSYLVSRWILLLAALEVWFYVFVYRRRRPGLQKGVYNPPLLNRRQREALFTKCSQQLPDSNYPYGWFSSSILKRENVVDWILWALFCCSPKDAHDSWNEEIDNYVKEVERVTGIKLEDGRVALTTSLRLNLDPVRMSHRPLIWYWIVAIVDLITCTKLYTLGFSHYSPRIFTRVFPPRFLTIISKQSSTKHFSYWYRPHRSRNRDPMVFIHGIGIGLYPYLPFIQDLIKLDPDVGILLIELLPITMHITADPIPSRIEMLDTLYATMTSLGISRAVLASHSYGTVIAAHVIRDHRPIPKPLITSFLLFDPVSFLLHLPAVAFNFLYRTPHQANEWQLWYFASQDPDIAYALGRCFFWADNILWKDDLMLPLDTTSTRDVDSSSTNSITNTNSTVEQAARPRTRFAVVLAGDDQIVPASDVRRYLTGEDEVKDRWVNEDGSLQVLYYPGLDHATVFDTKERRRDD